MIRFACPDCRWTLEVPEDLGGSMVRCPCCGRSLCVPTLLPVDASAGPRPATRAAHVLRPGTNPLRWVRARTARVLSLGRFGSPAALLLALLLFACPWIEVRCEKPLGDDGTRTLAERSGLQAAYGGYAEAPLAHTARAERDRLEARLRALQSEPRLSWAPLMVLYPLVLLSGSLLGFLAQRDRVRSAALVGCSLAAGLLLLLQASRGFSLDQAARTLDAKGRWAGVDLQIVLGTSGLLEVRYTPWFWLSAGALGGATAAACAERWLRRGLVRLR